MTSISRLKYYEALSWLSRRDDDYLWNALMMSYRPASRIYRAWDEKMAIWWRYAFCCLRHVVSMRLQSTGASTMAVWISAVSSHDSRWHSHANAIWRSIMTMTYASIYGHILKARKCDAALDISLLQLFSLSLLINIYFAPIIYDSRGDLLWAYDMDALRHIGDY